MKNVIVINDLVSKMNLLSNLKAGKMITLSFLMVSLTAFTGCKSGQSVFNSKVSKELSLQPVGSEEPLTENDIAHLPLPVRKYVEYSGAIGKSKPENVHIVFDAKMVGKPGAAPMTATSEQFNFFGSYSRLFLMKAKKMFIPFLASHTYREEKATFVVRVANLFNVVDIKGDELTTAETVTLLNDMCVFAPGNLYDKRLSWKEIDSLSSQVTLQNGRFKVSAIMYFNEKGELINFVSDDRSALQDDGTMKKARWSTPVSEYKEFDGRIIPTYGETIWNYPEKDFKYGTFTLKSIKYNITR
jgi:hypothetical protein